MNRVCEGRDCVLAVRTNRCARMAALGDEPPYLNEAVHTVRFRLPMHTHRSEDRAVHEPGQPGGPPQAAKTCRHACRVLIVFIK
jgi:hypothetical protein